MRLSEKRLLAQGGSVCRQTAIAKAAVKPLGMLKEVRKFALTCLLAPMLAAGPLAAHDIITTNLTYSRDISRIFARRCLSCHGAGSSVPLTSYQETRPWAVDIKEQVLSRSMPPWGAVKGFGNLLIDHALTQEEIIIITAWVVGGAPQGDPALLPKEQPAAPAPPMPPLRDAVTIATRTTLREPLTALGLRPVPDKPVTSARIVAQLPDGRIQPLVWLYRFDPKWNRVFRFREPVQLPPGTIVESSEPLRFALETMEATSSRATTLSRAR